MAVENGEEAEELEEDAGSRKFLLLFVAGLVLVFIGLIAIFAAVALGNGGSASAGIIIFIGPFPIVIGAGPDAGWLILIGIIIAVAAAVMFAVTRRKKLSSEE